MYTAGCIDTDLPAGRHIFGQSDNALIEIAHMHHAMWITFGETCCIGSLLIQEKAVNRTSGEPNLWSSSSVFMGIAQAYRERF
jgi:hypothetical protein